MSDLRDPDVEVVRQARQHSVGDAERMFRRHLSLIDAEYVESTVNQQPCCQVTDLSKTQDGDRLQTHGINITSRPQHRNA